MCNDRGRSGRSRSSSSGDDTSPQRLSHETRNQYGAILIAEVDTAEELMGRDDDAVGDLIGDVEAKVAAFKLGSVNTLKVYDRLVEFYKTVGRDNDATRTLITKGALLQSKIRLAPVAADAGTPQAQAGNVAAVQASLQAADDADDSDSNFNEVDEDDDFDEDTD